MTPSAQERYEIRVGIFTIGAMILFLFGWGWLKTVTWFHEPQRFTVQFHDVAGLNRNATVNINGVRVGVVENIELKAKGQVLVHPRITAPNVIVPRGSTVTIQTLGLVGAKYLEVTLPELKHGQPAPPPLDPNDVVIGEDPVRTELVVNQVANLVKDIVSGGKGKTLATNVGQAVNSINKLAGKINSSVDHFQGAADNVSAASQHIGDLAGSVQLTAGDARTFFNQGSSALKNADSLATDLRVTDQKINKLLDHPVISQDLKDVLAKAETVSHSVSATVEQLNKMLGNDSTRQDLITIMTKLNNSTSNIEHSLQTINDMSSDKDLRTDLKDLISRAGSALDRVHALLDRQSIGADLHDTINRVKSAASNVDVAAQELQSALQHKHPLIHLMFGAGIKTPASSILVVPLKDNAGRSTDNPGNPRIAK